MSNIEVEKVTETIIRWADGSVHIKAGHVTIDWPVVQAINDDPNGFADFAANIAVALNEGKVKPKRPYHRKVSPSPVTEGVA